MFPIRKKGSKVVIRKKKSWPRLKLHNVKLEVVIPMNIAKAKRN